ncbi:MAG TPA: hypothetical protein ENL03_06530 [Phycisphaerae bacterium]|nr:hypothetical protein [Phycisphaerae bacterium]
MGKGEFSHAIEQILVRFSPDIGKHGYSKITRPALLMPRLIATQPGTVLLCSIGIGCDAMSKPFPEKEFFALDVGDPPGATAKAGEGALRVRKLHIASPFNARSFVYRTGDMKFTTDYYNGFVTDPDKLLTGQLVSWLSQAGSFDAVVTSGSEAPHRYVLEGNVTELYGDYCDKANLKAVMKVRFFLLDDSQVETIIVFQKTYRSQAPLKGDTAEAFPAGLNEVYKQILTDLSKDLPESIQGR